MLLNDHDLYEGNLKTTGKLTNCVLSFDVQGSVFYIILNTVFGWSKKCTQGTVNNFPIRT